MKQRVVGQCKLCLCKGELLQESHLMPAGLYRRMRSHKKNPHPLMITTEATRASSIQVIDNVLCSDCESRFDSLGENYVLRMAAGHGRFRLLEMLEAATPSFTSTTGEWRGYSVADAPKVRRDQLAYFAFSIFWRASVHTWAFHDGEGKVTRINLGKGNSEALRRYLIGERPLPPTMMLLCFVLTDELSQNIFTLPRFGYKLDFCWTYLFTACGLEFLLTVGRRLTKELTCNCMVSSERQWIWVRDGAERVQNIFRSIIPHQPIEARWK